MALFSDIAVRRALPAERNKSLSDEQVRQLTIDAGDVYQYIHRQPGCTEGQLRKWGEGKGIDPDRMNLALEMLRATHKVYDLPDLPDTEPAAPSKSRRTAKGKAKS